MSMSDNKLGARAAHDAYLRDPDLRLRVPEKPRFMPELLVTALDSESVMVFGTPKRTVLSGRDATRIAARLLPELDGLHALDELSQALGGSANLQEALALLQRSALLENGACPLPDGVSSEVASFLGRFVPAGGFFESRAMALRELAASRVAVCSPPDLATVLIDTLKSCNVGDAFGIQDQAVGHGTVTHLLVVTDREYPADRWQQYIEKWPTARILLCHVGDNEIAVGPWVMPGFSACIGCSTFDRNSAELPGAKVHRRFAAQLIAQLMFERLSKLSEQALYGRSTVYREVDGQIEQRQLHISRRPGCEGCGLGCYGALDPRGDAFEGLIAISSTMLPPAELVSNRSHEGHYSPSVMALISLPDDSVDGVEVLLPRRLEEVSRYPNILGRVSAEAIGLALQFAYGFMILDNGQPKKLAPTGGNLRSPEGYVVLNGVSGILDGVYRYNPSNHSLIRVRAGLSKDSLAAALGVSLTESDCFCIGVSRLKRLWPKYPAFSPRLALLDGGVTQNYLHEALWALGFSTAELALWRRDSVLKGLQLPTAGAAYELCSVIKITPGYGDTARERDTGAFTDKRLGASLQSRSDSVRDSLDRWLSVTVGQPIEALISCAINRSAVRSFARTAVPIELCRQIAESIETRAATLQRGAGIELPLSTLLILNRTHAGSPGLFVYNRGRFETIHMSASEDEFVDCFNQRSIGSAPALFIITSDMEKLLASHGREGIGRAVTRAGALLSHGWLAACANGLVGCLAGGLLDPEWRVRARIDGYAHFPLFSLAVGYRM